VLDEAAAPVPEADDEDSNEVLDEFREFIEGVNPEDFAS
jgi:hypothetical protein